MILDVEQLYVVGYSLILMLGGCMMLSKMAVMQIVIENDQQQESSGYLD